MSFSPSTIASGIAGLSVSGLTIKDLDEIPLVIVQRDCPILIPDYSFVSNVTATSRGLGLGGSSVYSYEYDLNYLLYMAEVGAGRSNAEYMLSITQKVEALAAAIQAADTTLGAHRIFITGGLTATTLRDPADKLSFHGANLTIHVWESA